MATTQPAPARRRRSRWQRLALAAAVLVPLLLVAALVVYLAGGLDDDGAFRTEPPACPTVEPSLHLLGVAYTSDQDASNNCQLLLPRDHPADIPASKIIVSYAVLTPRRGGAPEAASEALRQLSTEARALSGVGDEAYIRDRDIFLRVSNLVVGIVVFPQQVSTDEQVRAFATDLANRLGTT